MKKTTSIFLFFFYAFGTFCLPLSDFSAIQNLPEMYHHCKSVEDKDMTVFDFVTDHLMDIDGVFDNHGNNDEQKPHNTNLQHVQSTYCQIAAHFCIQLSKKEFIPTRIAIFAISTFVLSDYHTQLLRPPITV